MYLHDMPTPTLQEQFGAIDIYLFDQLLKGNISPEMTILDAGCGFGRNIVYFLREGYQVFAADQSAECVEHVRRMALRIFMARFGCSLSEAVGLLDDDGYDMKAARAALDVLPELVGR